MTFKAFIFGLLASFGFPWIFAIILPYYSMNSEEVTNYGEDDSVQGVYQQTRSGRVSEGSKIYGQEGCTTCHTQLIRPTYAGWDVYRDEWAGLRKTLNNPDTRRETLSSDYQGEQIAHIGQSRVGPDLANLGRRLDYHLKGDEMSPRRWVLEHLYNPRATQNYRDGAQDIAANSSCPSKRGLFKVVDVYGATGSYLSADVGEGKGVLPTSRAETLASYLISLKKDTLGNPLPLALNPNPEAPASE